MKYEFVFDFLLMTCSSGKHSIMFRGGGSGCRAGWVVVLQGKSQKHESEINYSSVIVFRRGAGEWVHCTHYIKLSYPHFMCMSERKEQNCER